ncbi:MAG: HAMP domain-containing protein [Chloroflexi bacterium]|nr:HAMP domain-containing protein [Chloroflexota bacterium]
MEEPWHLVADPLLRATEQAPLLVVPVLLLTVLVVWWGIRQIVQPLQRLESQATRLGQGDFAAIETPVGGIPEIQHLQTQLVQMAHKVKAAQQNLRGYLGAVTTGQEEERRRLARDLHDETMQALIALNQQIQLAQLRPRTDPHPPLDKCSRWSPKLVPTCAASPTICGPVTSMS